VRQEEVEESDVRKTPTESWGRAGRRKGPMSTKHCFVFS
jgi:hypothetical protein